MTTPKHHGSIDTARRTMMAAALLVLARGPHQLTDADTRFASDARSGTVNAAFLKWFADSAVWFRPLPVSGRASLNERPIRADFDLRWKPVLSVMSHDGRFGITSGPATLGIRGSKPDGGTWYVSVWQRTNAGWRLSVDAGVSISEIPDLRRTESVREVQLTRAFSRDTALLQLDQRVSADYVTSFSRLATNDVLLLRSASPPARTKAEAMTQIRRSAAAEYTPLGWGESAAGDIGYVYGTAVHEGQTSGFERVYVRNARTRNWQIAVDLMN